MRWHRWSPCWCNAGSRNPHLVCWGWIAPKPQPMSKRGPKPKKGKRQTKLSGRSRNQMAGARARAPGTSPRIHVSLCPFALGAGTLFRGKLLSSVLIRRCRQTNHPVGLLALEYRRPSKNCAPSSGSSNASGLTALFTTPCLFGLFMTKAAF
jgi:hypothetical protein